MEDVKLTHLQTLVTGKARTVIAEFADCSTMYRDALKTLELKCGRPQAVASAFLDKLNSFPPDKMHNSDQIINFSGTTSNVFGMVRSLNYINGFASGSRLD